MDAVFIGIDVSKDRLDVHVRPSAERFAVARTGKGVDDLIARLLTLSPALIAVEATGGFESIVAAGLASVGLPIVVVNPAQVRAFAGALGKRAKTDPIDAAVIAHFAEATKPEIRPLPDEATQLLADLLARRRQIVEMIGAESQREKRASQKRLQKSIARLKKALEKELADIDADIDDNVRGSPVWRAKEDLLVSVPGVGPTIARTPDRRVARTRLPRPPPDRRSCRARAMDPPIRPMARQELHQRRARLRAHRPVHRRHGRRATQSPPQGLSRPPRRQRQT
jgi:transposase